MVFSTRDEEIMGMALAEAKKSLITGNYPVGSALVVNGEVIGLGGNELCQKENWVAHAENDLLTKYSYFIRKKYMPLITGKSKEKITIELFSTLEPCLMCLGVALLNRVSRIVYACPDPHGGATKMSLEGLPKWYSQKWPAIERGLLETEARDLLMSYFKKSKDEYSKEMIPLFEREITEGAP